MFFEDTNFCWFPHRIKGHTWFNACNSHWTNKINCHSVKIRKREGEEADYLAQAVIQLCYWYLLSTYCMHGRIALSISLWLLANSSPVRPLPPTLLWEKSSFTLSGSWRRCENWQVRVCEVREILRLTGYVNTEVCSLSRPQPASVASLISQVFLVGCCFILR